LIKKIFSYKEYKKTLIELKKDHKFVFFDEVTKNDIILRHDIDISLEPAVEMAKIEKELKIKSTFFILFQSPFYNAFSKNSIQSIQKIIKLGHRIGLHYDSSLIRKFNYKTNQSIKNEIEIMEFHFQTKIEVISSHMPSINKKIKIKLPINIIDADSGIFKKNRKYISDSVQNWRERSFSNYINEKNLYVLIHPIWWSKNNMNRIQILKSLSEGNLNLIKNETKQLKKIQSQYLNRLK
jgi:hypothetical protein